MDKLELNHIIKTLETLGIIETGEIDEGVIFQVINPYEIVVKYEYGRDARDAFAKALSGTYRNCSISEYCEMIESNKLYNNDFVFCIKDRKLSIYNEIDKAPNNSNSIKQILYKKLTIVYRKYGLID